MDSCRIKHQIQPECKYQCKVFILPISSEGLFRMCRYAWRVVGMGGRGGLPWSPALSARLRALASCMHKVLATNNVEHAKLERPSRCCH